MNEDNGRTILGNSDIYITNELNFRSDQFPIMDMGERKGISDIDMPNFINMAPEVAVLPGHGYVTCCADHVRTFGSQKKAIKEDADVYRIFVDSWIEDKEQAKTGANVYFLLGKPDESNQIPVWNSNIGTLTWNYETNTCSTLHLPLPSSKPDDIEIEFADAVGADELTYSINSNSVDFTLNQPFGTDSYKLRIRCKHVYTEVTLSVTY